MTRYFCYILLGVWIAFSNLYSQNLSESSESKKIFPEAEPGAKRWAIVVGINDYLDSGVSDLNKARNDAKLIAQILQEQGQFDELFLMTDDLSSRNPLFPTKANIEAKLDYLLDYSSPSDTILFFFSGHGIADPSGNGYLLSVDTTIEKALSTSVKVNDIMRKIKDRGVSKSILILDACRDLTNSTTKGFAREGFRSEKYATGDIPLTFFSTRTGYYSYEDPKSNFGVFSKYLAYGMEGQADSNQDGVVSFSELEEFVQRGVTQWSDQNDKEQKPIVNYSRDKYGKIPITFSSNKKISLVDENPYSTGNSKFPAVIRSMIVPGWGQWYSGGNEKGLSYLAIFMVLVGNAAYHYNPYQNAKSQYESTILIPARAGEGDTLGINYLLFEPKMEVLEKAKTNYNRSVSAVGIFWAWNVLDLFLFRGNNFIFALHINVAPVSNNVFYTRSFSDLDKKTDITFTVRF